MGVLSIDATNGNALQLTFYKLNFACLELSVLGFDRQNMLRCGIDCQFYQLGLGQVHLAKEVKRENKIFQTDTKQRFTCTLN